MNNRGNRASEAFSADWLSLREPVDHSARNADVANAFVAWCATRGDEVSIVDMGCGTGSTVRALAPRLRNAAAGLRQHWTLVDADDALLERARAAIGDDGALGDLGGLRVEFRRCNLSDMEAVAALLEETDCHAVTGSALIDLVSARWIDDLAAIARKRQIALYFALNYTGREIWEPAHRLDEKVLAAFSRDQRRDKGFGPALGGDSTAYFEHRMRDHDYHVTSGTSDWFLGVQDVTLMGELADGIAAAAERGGALSRLEADTWLEARYRATHAVIGHADAFACPR